MGLPLRLVGVLIALLIVASAAPNALAASKWRSSDPPCSVKLRDTSSYRTAPLPPKRLGNYLIYWLVQGYVRWNDHRYPNSASLTFRTCPPKRILMIGDSIAFTLAVPWLHGENSFGVELAAGPILGCTFGDKGQFVDGGGQPESLPSGCASAYRTWGRAVERLHADEVIVEMGLRSEFDWMWGQETVHLGQRQFETFTSANIEHLIRAVSKHGRKILFLTVPYSKPDPDKQDPANSRSRHRRINALIREVVHRHPHIASVYDIDKIISPGNHFDVWVHGTYCRFDGVHFTIQCANLLGPYVLDAARKLLGR